MPPKILIVHRPTPGLRQDRLALAAAFHSLSPPPALYWFEPRVVGHRDYTTPLDLSAFAPLLPFDLVVLLEDAMANPPLLDRAFARRTAFIPNPEWLLPIDAAILRTDPFDHVLLKTRHGHETLRALFPETRMPLATLGWSTEVAAGPAPEPVWHAALHLAGWAWQKNTETVLRAWLDDPALPSLTAARSLLFDPTAFLSPLTPAPHVTLHLRTLSTPMVRRLQQGAGLHVYPSAIEGFGHALNEARALGRILVTTGAPPMSELVHDGETGALVPAQPGPRLNLVQTATIHPRAIAETVARLLGAGEGALRRIGRAAQDAYLADRAAFHQAVASWSRNALC